jgi:hypothetical protein
MTTLASFGLDNVMVFVLHAAWVFAFGYGIYLLVSLVAEGDNIGGFDKLEVISLSLLIMLSAAFYFKQYSIDPDPNIGTKAITYTMIPCLVLLGAVWAKAIFSLPITVVLMILVIGVSSAK